MSAHYVLVVKTFFALISNILFIRSLPQEKAFVAYCYGLLASTGTRRARNYTKNA